MLNKIAKNDPVNQRKTKTVFGVAKIIITGLFAMDGCLSPKK
jgi:hypothetical protein